MMQSGGGLWFTGNYCVLTESDCLLLFLPLSLCNFASFIIPSVQDISLYIINLMQTKEGKDISLTEL